MKCLLSKKVLLLTLVMCPILVFSQKINQNKIGNEIALKWAKATLDFVNVQPTKSPTFVSRSLAYMGLAMYESVVNSSKKYRSVAPQLNDFKALPMPEKGLSYDWESALSESQINMLKLIWQPDKQPYGHFLVKKIDSLHNAILAQRRLIVRDSSVIERSRQYGKKIANEIFAWSYFDGGHEMNYLNFDPKYRFPAGPNYWVPPVGGQSHILLPLHPYWGKNRNFVKANANLPVPEMIPYSKDTASAYYKQFKMIYDIQKNLTQEQKEMANWWGDDPAFTTSPPGHSYNLALIINKIKKPDLVTSAMSFAKVGMACADAFINCWRCKYTYHSERPAAYIRKNIDGEFVQYWPEPPFPGFPSGHSTQASAAAEVLISVFGDQVSFTDDTHVGRQRDAVRNVDYKGRSFTKISQTAIECGISRLYGGIHTEQDNRVGMEEGAKIGRNINQLRWLN